MAPANPVAILAIRFVAKSYYSASYQLTVTAFEQAEVPPPLPALTVMAIESLPVLPPESTLRERLPYISSGLP